MIRGAGGGGGKGGGGGSSFYEQNDTIQSIQYARVLHLLGWGEIGGLVDGLKSIYLDDTPVQNADGSFNFTNCTFVSRTGTPSQDVIPGFSDTESETAISTRVRAMAPVVRRVADTTASAVRVTVGIPQLTYTDTSGNRMVGTQVQYAIDVNANGGGWVEKASITINDKSTSRYQRSTRVELSGTGPWDVRVRRITPDSTSSTLVNETWWDSMTEIIDYRLSYPHMALIGVNIDAKQFSSTPSCKFLLDHRKIQIPSNYDPVARTYSGEWDGTFKTAVSSNPPWCLYDMLTHAEYGLGRYIPPALQDKWTLYAIGRYCDELVPDGFGGLEPRYTLNVWINGQQPAYELLNSMVTVFRGMLFSAAGSLRVVADMPDTPKMLYTTANVVDGRFESTGTPRSQRHSVVVVKWSNPALMYQDDFEAYEDPELIKRFGVRKLEITGYGCTSRGQAHRMAKWALYSEAYDNALSFKTGLDKTSFLRPGDIVQIAETKRAGARMGGRIISATTSVVRLDAPVELDSSIQYCISVLLPDGSVCSRDLVECSGSLSDVELALPLPDAPLSGAVWVISSKNLAPITARIVSIKPSSGSKGIFEVSVIEWSADKFPYIDRDFSLDPVRSSSVASAPQPATGLVTKESLYEERTAVKSCLTVSWLAPSGVSYYIVSWQRNSDNWQSATTFSPNFDINDTQPGIYTVRVVAVDVLGRKAAATSINCEVFGLVAAPADIRGLDISALNGFALLTWPQSVDLDVRVGGAIRVKHSPVVSGATWANSTDIGPAVPGSATQVQLPLLEGTYLVKAVDSSGIESLNAVMVETNAPSVLAMNVIQVIDESAWLGAKSFVAAVDGVLKLDSAATVDAWPDVDAVANWDSGPTGIAPQGIYSFNQIVDVGLVQTSRVTGLLHTRSYAINDMVDTWVSVDSRPSWDGIDVGNTNAEIQISTTNTDPALENWSPWSTLRVGDYSARAFRFQLVLQSFDPGHVIEVDQLSVSVDMPDRTVTFTDVAIPASGMQINFSPPFMVPPTLGISGQGLAPGENINITARSNAGFFVTVQNASGAGVARSIDVVAKGYGGY